MLDDFSEHGTFFWPTRYVCWMMIEHGTFVWHTFGMYDTSVTFPSCTFPNQKKDVTCEANWLLPGTRELGP